MTAQVRPREAVCCCGACAITVEGEPVINALCHCSSCKRRTGSAFGWSLYFPAASAVTRGAFGTYARRDIATPYERFFCTTCGTTLYWRTENFLPDYVGVAGGCFVEAPDPPNLSSSDAGRCAWFDLPEGWMIAP